LLTQSGVLLPISQTASAVFHHLQCMNSDVSVTCGPEHINLSIYLCPMYNAFYNESWVVLNNQTNNPKCYGTADFTVDPPRLRFSNLCNSFYFNFSYVQYVTVFGTVTSIDRVAGMITYRPQIRYNFSCTYRMKYLFNNTKLSVIKSNDGRLFNMLSMQLYKDKQCQEILTIPETGLEVKTKIYVEVKAINLKDRQINVICTHLHTDTFQAFSSTCLLFYYRYTRDAQIMVEINGVSQKALFSFEAFRLVDNEYETVSTFYLLCATRLCEVSKRRSLLSVTNKPPMGLFPFKYATFFSIKMQVLMFFVFFLIQILHR
uniref:Si:dkey-4p15.5 n=1 Tax=Pundamilia nyererei TaxID=303518 RepID=A0A3B4GDK9_9CICH